MLIIHDFIYKKNILYQYLDIPQKGFSVHFRGYYWLFVFKFEPKNSHIAYIATIMKNPTQKQMKHNTESCGFSSQKQTCDIERCPPRTERAQRNHIFMAIAAWFEQQQRRIQHQTTLYQQNWNVIKGANLSSDTL